MSISVFSSNCKKNLCALLISHIPATPSDFVEDCCKEYEWSSLFFSK